MNERQRRIAAALQRGLNGIAPTEMVAYALGYRPARKGILPVTSSLRAMERAGIVGRLPPEDQWCVAKWFLTQEGKDLMLKGVK